MEDNNKKKKETLLKEDEYMIRWVDAYFNNNFNGRITSKALKPHLTLESCEVDAARMLGKDRVKELIELKQEQVRKEQNIDLGFLIFNLKKILIDVSLEETERCEITNKITSKPDRNSALKAIDILAKLGGYYTERRDITSNGQSITPEIKINIIKPDNTDGN